MKSKAIALAIDNLESHVWRASQKYGRQRNPDNAAYYGKIIDSFVDLGSDCCREFKFGVQL